MITASVTSDEASLRVEIQTDGAPHPDLLDEVCSRCLKLWTQVQAGLVEGGDGGEHD